MVFREAKSVSAEEQTLMESSKQAIQQVLLICFVWSKSASRNANNDPRRTMNKTASYRSVKSFLKSFNTPLPPPHEKSFECWVGHLNSTRGLRLPASVAHYGSTRVE